MMLTCHFSKKEKSYSQTKHIFRVSQNEKEERRSKKVDPCQGGSHFGSHFGAAILAALFWQPQPEKSANHFGKETWDDAHASYRFGEKSVFEIIKC